MDTPQSSKPSISSINNNNNKLINPTSSNSPIFQDSPVFNYISNLSPIHPVKAEPGAQGFPGLSSPPLLFTSPRITSLQSLLTRKLHSSGSLEPPQDNDRCHKNDGDPSNSAKAGPECNNLFISKLQRAPSVNNLEEAAHCSPGCIDDFLSDPYANSSSKRQSGDTSQSSGGGSAPVKVKQGAHARSRINIRVVKNEVRHLGSLSRLSTEHAFEVCKDGESLNEASHLERGTLRRCLFEENQRNRSDESELRNFSDNVTSMEDMTILPSTTLPGNREVLKRPTPLTGSCVSPVTESYPVAISKPLGIGLHLNSVVYPKSLDSSTSQQSSLAGLEGKTSVLTSSQSDSEVDATIAAKVPSVYEERQQDKACSIATKGETKPLDIGRFSSPVLLKPDNHTTAAPLKRKIGPQTFESDEVPCKMSPKKKRKKPSNPSDDDNPKRCNCKKTKCLKLYCDCFAAGLYCSEACACQGCCNHFENEGTVLETRKQIESRNPLAFAPKIVQQVTESPASIKEVQNLPTPSSARHKSGCNCKKSMCLKKYCECYQANVGCSDGCRCEGCKNVFGIREDNRIFAGFMVKRAADEMSEAIGERRLENTNVGSNFDNSRLHNSPNLTPATPALQCSDLKMNGLKSQLPLMRYLETPDSQNDVLSSDENLSTCPENSQSHSLILQKSKESIDEGALYAEKPSEKTRDILESSSKTYNSRNTSDPHLLDERVVQPMSSTLRWRSSPRTPVIQPLGVKFQDLCSESKHSNMSLIEDDTPNVLKDSSTPSEPLKVSSPNKKRISAPHNPIGSSGSLSKDSTLPNPTNPAGSLKICHRFVLQSLPTFPSLTPFSKKQPGE